MVNQKSLAKIGVFLLLGVNVAAYCIFWPKYQERIHIEAKAAKQASAEAPTAPAPNVPRPAEIAVSTPKHDDDDAVRKLLEHIKRETEPVSGVTVIELPIPMPATEQEKSAKKNEPNPLAWLKAEPIVIDKENPEVAVTSALTVERPASPWQLSIDAAGPQTLLVAKLRQAGAAEFRILGDHVEQPLDNGPVQAVGNVTFVGPGVKGSCQRLTVFGNVARISFEEQVRITPHGANGSCWAGEGMVWEGALNQPSPPLRATLGEPK